MALNLVLAENLKLAGRLVRRFPGVVSAFQAPKEELLRLGMDEAEAALFRSPGLLEKASLELERMLKMGYAVLTMEDEDYPERLREIYDPPCVLYCAGRKEVLKEAAVAIVGARKPTPYGRAVAEKLAADLAGCGLIVVSGMAAGIDSIAHWGALGSGRTIAVLGSGLDNIYPRENRKLFEKIIENGAVVSEFPPDSPPLAFHFPLRNRVISGLSVALVVVEANRRSGSLISARFALEQNREVMAVPGNVTSELSQGTNWLIKSGAKLVEIWEDVAEEFPPPLRDNLLSRKREAGKKPAALTSEEKEILDCLSADTLVHIDELVERTDYSVSEMLAILLNLELKELVFQCPGKNFQRRM